MLLRQLLAETDPRRIRHRLWRLRRLRPRRHGRNHPPGDHHRTWCPAIVVALTEQVTNARAEGLNRTVKQVKRVGCGFRNMDNYQQRIMAQIAVTRPRGQAA